MKFITASTIQWRLDSQLSLLASPSPSLCCCGSTSPCVSGCLLQTARVSQALWGRLPLPTDPVSPSLHLCLCLSVFLYSSRSPHLPLTLSSVSVCVSAQRPLGAPSIPARRHVVAVAASHLSSSHGPCPHPRGLQSPDWDEAAKGKGRGKGSRLPRVTHLGGGEARECRGAQTGCRRARTGWRGQLCTESLGPGQRLPLTPPGPFSAGPFPLEIVLAWGLCTSRSLRLECPSPRSPYSGMSLPTPPPGSPP